MRAVSDFRRSSSATSAAEILPGRRPGNDLLVDVQKAESLRHEAADVVRLSRTSARYR
jgi:hypothetical protein